MEHSDVKGYIDEGEELRGLDSDNMYRHPFLNIYRVVLQKCHQIF